MAEELAQDFMLKLKRRQVEGSLSVAKRTAEVLRQVVSAERKVTQGALLDAVKAVGARLVRAQPREVSIGNMVRRVLHIIREEEANVSAEGYGEEAGHDQDDAGAGKGLGGVLPEQFASKARVPSLVNLLEAADVPVSPKAGELAMAAARAAAQGKLLGAAGAKGHGGGKAAHQLKSNVIETVNELIDELDGIIGQISDQAIEHIHAHEVVLTVGNSKTVAEFLKEAAKKRTFQVVVAEGSPTNGGQQLAMELANAGIPTTAITDGAIFAMMARVNMVVVGTHALLANGGAMAPVGTHMVALAAQRHAVPLVMLSGLQKLTPLFPHNPAITMNDMQSPASVLDFDAHADGMRADDLHALNPAFDYIPPELISLFVTDTGGHTPSYVYRLLAEYYSPEDYNL